MDKYLLRKRPRDLFSHAPSLSPPAANSGERKAEVEVKTKETRGGMEDDEESTDVKLATLASLYADISQDILLDLLIANDGSIPLTCSAVNAELSSRKKIKRSINGNLGIQSSLSSYGMASDGPAASSKTVTKRGQTLHLFSPQDISKHTPCTIIHNFLSAEDATSLLKELLCESETFSRQRFQLFENVVESPHSTGFYVSSSEEQRQQKSEYAYNGNYRTDVRQLTPELRRISKSVQKAVNEEIQKRIRDHYPNGKKLQYQSPLEWVPNAAFVNCYDGPSESVGYHSDELTYLGPRAVIASLSLGVAREFRVRKVVPPDEANVDGSSSSSDTHPTSRADIQGQISIHLPHNSLLVMHAEMQEEWKHSIAPSQMISPHPVSGNKRINVTYRWYRASLHPKNTPRCRCGMPCVLRCVQKKKENRGRYMWMCYAGYAPGKKTCAFFQWASFDDNGEPIWE
ncbi:GRF zinc finger family protein [Coccidioides posadasii C735 delta SOWgp]|uniref:GRF zinc finger family protein n=1 Tax=Coccidioides posadasii (strain C735) TaxID=222929 RepID=C5PAD9_COCP7|nr:GRF zinc finger family protein [Coccidioides posadasii C735 delta SOWgp]EER26701.1 GRF zinc finger family protein [Coccidioides posadasii C735 delta SOWgp]|eukprot:XP_003068846.1 GRF zinc finger family protein [Coccidioides posadasii C735 delta SOWgp]